MKIELALKDMVLAIYIDGDRCGLCAAGYFRSGNNVCTACGGTNVPILITVLVIFFISFTILVYLSMKVGKYFAALSISINYFQILYIFKSLLLNWSKEVLNMYDIVSIVSFNLELARPECLDNRINYFSKGESFFLLPPIILGCLLIASLLGAPPFNYLAVLVKSLYKQVSFKLIKFPSFSTTVLKSNIINSIKAFHVLLQFIYVSLASWALGYYNCIPFGDKIALKKEPAQLCYQGKHASHQAYFDAAIVIYVVGIPVYFSFLYFCVYQSYFTNSLFLKLKHYATLLIINKESIFKQDKQFIIVMQFFLKLSIILVQNFLINSIPTQAVIIQFVFFIYIGFLLYSKPYVEWDHNMADIVCQCCSIATIACGILFYTTSANVLLTVIVIGITCLCVISAVVFVARDIKRASKAIQLIKLNKKLKSMPQLRLEATIERKDDMEDPDKPLETTKNTFTTPLVNKPLEMISKSTQMSLDEVFMLSNNVEEDKIE